MLVNVGPILDTPACVFPPRAGQSSPLVSLSTTSGGDVDGDVDARGEH